MQRESRGACGRQRCRHRQVTDFIVRFEEAGADHEEPALRNREVAQVRLAPERAWRPEIDAADPGGALIDYPYRVRV